MHLAWRVVGVMISLRDVTCLQGRMVAVEKVSCDFAPGLSAIAGPNGAGKTTLLRAIAGLHRLAGGEINIDGKCPKVALLPQATGLDRRFPITCRELVAFGAWGKTGPFATLLSVDQKRIDAAMEQMGLGRLRDRLVGALSAGQFQRVLFARLIVEDRPSILLDEPFTAVDTATEADLLALLHVWEREGRTVVAVLHDNEMILQHFPTTLLLARHAVAFGPSASVLSGANRQAARRFSEEWIHAATQDAA